jgi:hypothetical protein
VPYIHLPHGETEGWNPASASGESVSNLPRPGSLSPQTVKSRPGPPMTLGGAAAVDVRLIVWCLPFEEPRLRRASRLRREPHGFAVCRNCRHQVEAATASLRAAEGGTSGDPAAKLLTEPSQMASPAEMARRYGPETAVLDWHKRLVCSRCGSHDTDMVVTGERR